MITEEVESSWTTKKLEEVKNIIEKPEEKWRVLWHQPRWKFLIAVLKCF